MMFVISAEVFTALSGMRVPGGALVVAGIGPAPGKGARLARSSQRWLKLYREFHGSGSFSGYPIRQ